MDLKSIVVKLLFVISQIIVINAFNAASKVGTHCLLTKTGQPGVCDYQKNCQEVMDELKKGRFPTICGFANRQQIVCCPNRQVTSDVRISTKSKLSFFHRRSTMIRYNRIWILQNALNTKIKCQNDNFCKWTKRSSMCVHCNRKHLSPVAKKQRPGNFHIWPLLDTLISITTT